jgi:hypothetical protein
MLITVDQVGDDEEIRQTHRNIVLDTIAEANHAQQFQAMDDCVFLREPLRSLYDG